MHPLTVEPVVWVGERKTLLAAFFALWCLILYVRGIRGPRRKLHLPALVMYALALPSKPTAAPLPVLLLLLDYWPFGRLSWRSVLEKVPFLAVGAAFAVVTVVSHARTAGILPPGEHHAGHP